ncbi:hypothetical protein NMA510612_0390 [Neisseria meningitidis]|uniref:Uncharacterized protein n=1 Tax=Neisseria meningitidis TaxID=487 RepID=X5EMN7_NEIME|nr:hypothetical protein NMA510612_0390 [Neisseria meningitidis]
MEMRRAAENVRILPTHVALCKLKAFLSECRRRAAEIAKAESVEPVGVMPA